jgi:hypothetical protein
MAVRSTNVVTADARSGFAAACAVSTIKWPRSVPSAAVQLGGGMTCVKYVCRS